MIPDKIEKEHSQLYSGCSSFHGNISIKEKTPSDTNERYLQQKKTLSSSDHLQSNTIKFE